MANRTTVAARAGLLAAVALLGSCTESVGPARRGPGGATFSFSPNGIALDQWNGALNQDTTRIIKGFNPTNPHHGDAIVATFFWIGSTNTIDSVTDHLTDN